jgi:16S rRNA (uracil1498-N3)-methyltransferase
LVLRRPLHVSQLAAHVAEAPLALVGVEGAAPVAEVLQRRADAIRAAAGPGAKPCVLLIGPEGDFTPEELDALVAAGAQQVGLGPNRLRVETAALAMLTAVTLARPA